MCPAISTGDNFVHILKLRVLVFRRTDLAFFSLVTSAYGPYLVVDHSLVLKKYA